jgi:beta-glucosidase
VVQLYLTDVLGSVARPVMELKGFQRITLRPGESREVEFIVTPAMLTMLNAEMQQVIEPGDFRIMIGGSSKDIRLRGILTVR